MTLNLLKTYITRVFIYSYFFNSILNKYKFYMCRALEKVMAKKYKIIYINH